MRYKKASKKEKGKILDEFCESYECSRGHAIKMLGRGLEPNITGRGRKRKYDPKVIPHLVRYWKLTNRMCSKRLKAALPIWIKYDTHPTLTDELKRQLLSLSPATIDRYIKPFRNIERGLSGTKPGSMIKSRIPIDLLTGSISKPGSFQMDTVMHCGNTMLGSYAVSLTMTDLYSCWTENRACWTKDSKAILASIQEIRNALPFDIKSVQADSGSEFINWNVFDYMNNVKLGKIRFTRSRPYKKNDNAHVEQKNHTHVRQLLGYARYDELKLLMLINDIYKNYWNPLQNYFYPAMKLKSKTRIGGRLRKNYDTPKTPYERVLECEKVEDHIKENLKLTIEHLNPIKLKEGLEKKLRLLQSLLTPSQIKGERQVQESA